MIVFSGFTAQILLQFALQLLLARLFGASREMDAYGAGMALPISLAAALVGTLGPVRLPDPLVHFNTKAQNATVQTTTDWPTSIR